MRPISRSRLGRLAALIWGIPGVIISVKGLTAYLQQPLNGRWWMPLTTGALLLFFYGIFRRIVSSYLRRIATLKEPLRYTDTFPEKGWFLLGFMILLGLLLRLIPNLPIALTATFYSGLGPMLLYSAQRFWRGEGLH